MRQVPDSELDQEKGEGHNHVNSITATSTTEANSRGVILSHMLSRPFDVSRCAYMKGQMLLLQRHKR